MIKQMLFSKNHETADLITMQRMNSNESEHPPLPVEFVTSFMRFRNFDETPSSHGGSICARVIDCLAVSSHLTGHIHISGNW